MDVAEVTHRGVHPPITVTGVAVAGVQINLVVVPAVAKETIYVTKVALNVTTVAAQAIIVRDTAGRVVFSVPASAAIGSYSTDFGPDGFPCTEGAGLELFAAAAGPAGAYQVLGYRRATSTRTIAESKAGIA